MDVENNEMEIMSYYPELPHENAFQIVIESECKVDMI